MTTDRTAPGAARIVKTARVQHIVTAGDITNGYVDLDVTWDTPFVDLNYTSSQNVEVITPADPTLYWVDSFQRAADKVTVTVGTAGSPGDLFVVHSHGIRD